MRTASRDFFGGEMNLNKQSWYVRWFFWSLGILEEFVEYPADRYKRSTNLCHFVRVVLAYAPLALSLNLVFYAAAIGVVTVWPVYLFGFVAYSKTLAFVVGGVFVWFMVRVIRGAREVDDEVVKRKIEVVSAASSEPTFRQVVGEWLGAKKAKICPLVTFKDSKGVTNA